MAHPTSKCEACGQQTKVTIRNEGGDWLCPDCWAAKEQSRDTDEKPHWPRMSLRARVGKETPRNGHNKTTANEFDKLARGKWKKE